LGEWLDRYRATIVAILILVIAAGSAAFWLRRPQPTPLIISTPAPTATPTPVQTPTSMPLRVYVTGAIRQPDVYRFAPGSIVKDAIAAAGGATADADLDGINLAVQLQDQQQVHVPRQGEGAPPVPPVAAPPAAGSRSGSVSLSSANPSLLNINTASASELETLPGIGPTYARRIVEYREQNGPFATIEEVMEVKGIGPGTFAKLEGLIAVR
jgi:competence protein ComEA